MTDSRKVIREILDLTEQAAAVRRTMTFGMPNAAWKGCNQAQNVLIDEAIKLKNENNDLFTTEEKFIIRVSIDRVMDIDIKTEWNK